MPLNVWCRIYAHLHQQAQEPQEHAQRPRDVVPAGRRTRLLLVQLLQPGHILGQRKKAEEQPQHWFLLPQGIFQPSTPVLEPQPLPLVNADCALLPVSLHRPLGWGRGLTPLLIVTTPSAILLFWCLYRHGIGLGRPRRSHCLAGRKRGGSCHVILLLLLLLLRLISLIVSLLILNLLLLLLLFLLLLLLHYTFEGFAGCIQPLPIW